MRRNKWLNWPILAWGAPSRPDPRRPGFYEVEGLSSTYYGSNIRRALGCCCSRMGARERSRGRHGGVLLSGSIIPRRHSENSNRNEAAST